MIQATHTGKFGRYLVATLLALTMFNCKQAAAASASTSATIKFAGLHVQMGADGSIGHLVNGSNQIVQLHGADHAGSEWTCLYSASLNSNTSQTSINAMKAWNINAVRIPLNEDCWLGINGVIFGGAKYQAALKAYVNLLTANGMAVILDLHWAAPGSELANGQLGMADQTHALTFWSQVATAYLSHGASDTSGNSMVIFDLFNEPFITNWSCWLNGGTCAAGYNGASYAAAGMKQLYAAVRATGARNVVILGGIGYSGNFAQWVTDVKQIPNGFNIAASWHVYSNNATYNNFQYSCPNQWNSYGGKCPTAAQTAATAVIPSVLAAGYPFVVGETEVSYEGYPALLTWWQSMLTWMDDQDQSYLAWDWNTVAPPLLITNFDGAPTASGRMYEDHIASLR
ncbi:MAG: cellulase family glycosylhydrolase [Steroidobacteraceae bacterium]